MSSEHHQKFDKMHQFGKNLQTHFPKFLGQIVPSETIASFASNIVRHRIHLLIH